MNFKYTLEMVKAVLTKSSKVTAKDLLVDLNRMVLTSSINTPERCLAFLAQIAHETGNFKWLNELGGKYYFDKYDKGTSIGRRLGNNVYGDGYKFKGRGFIQLTGRYNYTQFQKYLDLRNPDGSAPDIIHNPNLVSKLPLALDAAVWYWENRKLNRYADSGDFRMLTKAINGGYNGYSDRLEKHKLLYSIYRKVK